MKGIPHLAIEFLSKFTPKLKIKIFTVSTSYGNEIIIHLPTSERTQHPRAEKM